DLEDVLAVKQSGNGEMAEPPEFAVSFRFQHRRSERHPPGPGGLHEHLELRADLRFAGDPSDERIPIRERGEVRERIPDTARGGLDVDPRPDFLHRTSCGRRLSSTEESGGLELLGDLLDGRLDVLRFPRAPAAASRAAE